LLNIKKNIEPYRTLVKNFTSLSILQITNYLFPLITLPYLVRVLGPEKYGLVNFAMAFVAYFVTISDYGFNLSVTKQISIFRADKQKINEIFSSVIISKFLYSIISLVILLAITISFNRFSADSNVFLFSFGIVIGNTLFPIWFYQGIEEMKFITIITFICRSIGTVMIFLIINDVNDYLQLVMIYSSIAIVIGIAGLTVAIQKFKVLIVFPKLSSVRFQIKEGFQIFISIAAINLYSTTNIFLLGLLVNDTAVGYFAAADKIRTAAQNILPTISQTVFPHINKLLNESYDKFIAFNRNLLKYQSMISLFISLVLFMFAEAIVNLILGNQFPESILVLKILSILPFLSSFTTIFAVNTLIPLDLKNEFMKTFLIAGVFSFASALFLVPVYKQFGTAIAFVLAEVIAAFLSFSYVKRKTNLFARKWI
jgi:PST family polysaccharide transporter